MNKNYALCQIIQWQIQMKMHHFSFELCQEASNAAKMFRLLCKSE